MGLLAKVESAVEEFVVRELEKGAEYAVESKLLPAVKAFLEKEYPLVGPEIFAAVEVCLPEILKAAEAVVALKVKG